MRKSCRLHTENGADCRSGHHETCIADLQARGGSTCAVAPFGGCRNICGGSNHDFWCARNEPFPEILFVDPSQEDRMSPKEVETIDIVLKGKFSLEATTLQTIDSNTGTITDQQCHIWKFKVHWY